MCNLTGVPIKTERLVLRRLEIQDAESLFRLFSDPQVMRYWSTPPWTDRDAAYSMIAQDRQMDGRDYLRLAITLEATNRLIGTCTLFSINETCRRAEIGYALSAAAWGHGYMNEALIALLDHGFATLNLNRVEADIDPRNHASAKTLERLGFTQEGLLRERWIVDGEVSDSALYGLLQGEWAARNGH